FELVTFPSANVPKPARHMCNPVLIPGAARIVKAVIVVDETELLRVSGFVDALDPCVRVLYVRVKRRQHCEKFLFAFGNQDAALVSTGCSDIVGTQSLSEFFTT